MPPGIFNSLIQSNMGGGPHGNFEAAIINLEGKLQHWWRDNSADGGENWKPGQFITGPADQAAGPASIIQSDFREGDHYNFEVVVPLLVGGKTQLWHFWRRRTKVCFRKSSSKMVLDSFCIGMKMSGMKYTNL